MKKLKYIFTLILAVLFIGCQTDDVTQGSLNIPERFWGEYTGVNTRNYAKIEAHKITVRTATSTYTRTEGVVVEDNGTTYFEASLPNNEQLVLVKNDIPYVGIALSSPAGFVFANDYYFGN